jgi:PEP-CTERM motif
MNAQGASRWGGAARCALVSALLAATLSGTALAQGIVLQQLSDNSDTTPDIDNPQHDVRFASRVVADAPTLVGDRAEIDLRYSWSFGVLSSSPVPNPVERQLGWTVTLKVEDPDERGFELSLNSRLRGVVGAGLTYAPVGFSSAALPALDIWMYEAFATTPQRLEGLETDAAQIGGAQDVNRMVVDQSGRATAGRYRGTQSFLFYLQPAETEILAYSGFSFPAYAWLQFGRGTTDPEMAFMNPGPGAPALDTLGQFVTFRVDYAALPVPEPSTWALLAAGLLFTARAGRRRAA